MPTLSERIFTLVKSAIGAETLVFADQNSPRPPLPYWTLVIQSSAAVGRESVGQGVNDDGDQKVSGVRESTVRLQRMGAGSVQACEGVRDLLQTTTSRESWQVQQLALYNISSVLNVPFKLDNSQLEPRSTFDLSVRHGIYLLDRVGIIETVRAEYIQ